MQLMVGTSAGPQTVDVNVKPTIAYVAPYQCKVAIEMIERKITGKKHPPFACQQVKVDGGPAAQSF